MEDGGVRGSCHLGLGMNTQLYSSASMEWNGTELNYSN